MGIFPMRLAFNGPKNCLNAFPYDDYSKRLRKMRLAAYSSKNYFCNCSVTRELDFGTAAKKNLENLHSSGTNGNKRK